MTSFSLLLWIVLGVALQLAIFLGIVFWRHWLDYLALRNGGAGLNVPTRAGRGPRARSSG